MRKCVECASEYDPNEAFYSDICDECAAVQEGVDSIDELR